MADKKVHDTLAEVLSAEDYDRVVESFEQFCGSHGGVTGQQTLAHLNRAYESAKNRGTLDLLVNGMATRTLMRKNGGRR